jgi:hypothetical protein
VFEASGPSTLTDIRRGYSKSKRPHPSAEKFGWIVEGRPKAQHEPDTVQTIVVVVPPAEPAPLTLELK